MRHVGQKLAKYVAAYRVIHGNDSLSQGAGPTARWHLRKLLERERGDYQVPRGGRYRSPDPSHEAVGAAVDRKSLRERSSAGTYHRPHLESGALEPVLEPWW
ncbi:MAG: hypothetical protein JWN85_4503 [Gammaproteobacteria bacterium]|nr:hypothetical protein [Gammaproteobacteria bacterium]